MWRVLQFLLVGGLLTISAVAQRRGGGLHGGGFVGPGFRGDGSRGFRGGFFPGNRFVGFGSPDDWPDYSGWWSSSDHASTNPGYGYLSCEPVDKNSYDKYGCVPSAPVVNQSPPRITVYSGAGESCPQTNGKPLYRIAIPADELGREREVQLRYQNNLWVAHDYSYTKGILNFVTPEGERKQTPVSSINRALTLQLNRECGANFQLPR
jgi:hypothetical protein